MSEACYQCNREATQARRAGAGFPDLDVFLCDEHAEDISLCDEHAEDISLCDAEDFVAEISKRVAALLGRLK